MADGTVRFIRKVNSAITKSRVVMFCYQRAYLFITRLTDILCPTVGSRQASACPGPSSAMMRMVRARTAGAVRTCME